MECKLSILCFSILTVLAYSQTANHRSTSEPTTNVPRELAAEWTITGKPKTGAVEYGCVLFESNDGRQYTLIGEKLDRLKMGEQVQLVVEPLARSHCMQGRTLLVKSVRK